jgi:hypothetical protein
MTGAGAGMGYFVGSIGDDPGAASVWGGIFGFGAASAIMYFLREYLLYLVKAGHIAVLVELMDGKDIPGGRAQIDHAQKAVRERFAQSSILFALDQIIKGVPVTDLSRRRQTPNAEWEARLDKLSGKFSSLKDKAKTWGASGQPEPESPLPHREPGH